MTSQLLIDRLLHVRLTPVNPASADVSVLLSAGQMIFEAGQGTRFELDGWATDREEMLHLARGVAAGGLTEDVAPGRVRFELHLPGGQLHTGGTVRWSWNLLARPTRIHCPAYGPTTTVESDR